MYQQGGLKLQLSSYPNLCLLAQETLPHFVFLQPGPGLFKMLYSTIHWINHYPKGKYYGDQLRYPVDSALSSG